MNNSIQQKRINCKQRSCPKFQKYSEIRCKTKIPKKPRVFQNSKIPKIFGEISLFLNFLEFWKTRGFFWILIQKHQKNPSFFGICYEIPKKHRVFQGFLPKFQKNLEFFWILQNSKKKNLEFSKIPKISRRGLSPQIFLEFWKTRGFFGIVWESKRSWYHFFLLLAMPKWYKNSKNWRLFTVFKYMYKKTCKKTLWF